MKIKRFWIVVALVFVLLSNAGCLWNGIKVSTSMKEHMIASRGEWVSIPIECEALVPMPCFGENAASWGGRNARMELVSDSRKSFEVNIGLTIRPCIEYEGWLPMGTKEQFSASFFVPRECDTGKYTLCFSWYGREVVLKEVLEICEGNE